MKISDNLLKTTFKRPSLPQHFGKLIFGRNLLHGVDLEGKLILFIFIYCILKINVLIHNQISCCYIINLFPYFQVINDPFRILLMNESSDWKHLLETASGTSEKLNHSEKQASILNTTDLICEFVLLDSNYYAQARNILLFKVLTTEDDDDSESIINSFIAMLYNIHLDEDSFFRMQSSLQRYVLSDYLLLVQFLLKLMKPSFI